MLGMSENILSYPKPFNLLISSLFFSKTKQSSLVRCENERADSIAISTSYLGLHPEKPIPYPIVSNLLSGSSTRQAWLG